MSDIASFFTSIYKRNDWGDETSRSGAGSSLSATSRIRTDLPSMLRYLKVTSLLDAPCGDFHWMNDVDLKGVNYIGCDIVEEIVEKNQKAYARLDREFRVADLITDVLPAADAVICRDCLIHFSNDLALEALKNLARSQSRFLILTTYNRLPLWESVGWANVELDHDPDIGVSYLYRPINLRLAPFNLPAPLHLLFEDKDSDRDKALGIWSTQEVRRALGV